MIQPGLIPLQPNLDFMDSFEPLQGNDNALYHSDKLQNNVTCTNFNRTSEHHVKADPQITPSFTVCSLGWSHILGGEQRAPFGKMIPSPIHVYLDPRIA